MGRVSPLAFLILMGRGGMSNRAISARWPQVTRQDAIDELIGLGYVEPVGTNVLWPRLTPEGYAFREEHEPTFDVELALLSG